MTYQVVISGDTLDQAREAEALDMLKRLVVHLVDSGPVFSATCDSTHHGQNIDLKTPPIIVDGAAE